MLEIGWGNENPNRTSLGSGSFTLRGQYEGSERGFHIKTEIEKLGHCQKESSPIRDSSRGGISRLLNTEGVFLTTEGRSRKGRKETCLAGSPGEGGYSEYWVRKCRITTIITVRGQTNPPSNVRFLKSTMRGASVRELHSPNFKGVSVCRDRP